MLVEFTHDLASGCWHGHHGGKTYTIQPGQWASLIWIAGHNRWTRLIDMAYLTQPGFVVGHTRIPSVRVT